MDILHPPRPASTGGSRVQSGAPGRNPRAGHSSKCRSGGRLKSLALGWPRARIQSNLCVCVRARSPGIAAITIDRRLELMARWIAGRWRERLRTTGAVIRATWIGSPPVAHKSQVGHHSNQRSVILAASLEPQRGSPVTTQPTINHTLHQPSRRLTSGAREVVVATEKWK